MRNVLEVTRLAILAAVTASFGELRLRAQEETQQPADKPNAVTTSDPEIPVEHLKLLVKPLTKEELVVEADAWRDLLKAKVQERAEQQIAVKKETQTAEKAEEAGSGEAAGATDTPKQEAAAERPVDAEMAEERKRQMAESIPQLQEEQAHLVDRLNVVVDALEKKGGRSRALPPVHFGDQRHRIGCNRYRHNLDRVERMAR